MTQNLLGVSRELGEPVNAVGTISSLVGYAIRLESNVTRNTHLAYVTNGIALRMLEGSTGQGDAKAFDELTVCQFSIRRFPRVLTETQHIIIDEVMLDVRPDRHVADSSTLITGPRADDRVGFPSHRAEKATGTTFRSQVSSSVVTSKCSSDYASGSYLCPPLLMQKNFLFTLEIALCCMYQDVHSLLIYDIWRMQWNTRIGLSQKTRLMLDVVSPLSLAVVDNLSFDSLRT